MKSSKTKQANVRKIETLSRELFVFLFAVICILGIAASIIFLINPASFSALDQSNTTNQAQKAPVGISERTSFTITFLAFVMGFAVLCYQVAGNNENKSAKKEYTIAGNRFTVSSIFLFVSLTCLTFFQFLEVPDYVKLLIVTPMTIGLTIYSLFSLVEGIMRLFLEISGMASWFRTNDPSFEKYIEGWRLKEIYTAASIIVPFCFFFLLLAFYAKTFFKL
jgi:hypothetical protein